jgi:hypothetical protein
MKFSFHKVFPVKGTCFLGSGELVYRIECIIVRKIPLKVEYKDPHKHASKLHGFPITWHAW